MGEIVISIDSQAVERAIYWILIIVLAGFLLWCYLGNGSCNADEEITAAATEDTTAEGGEDFVPLEDADTEPVVVEPEETCSDGIKNQYETDVDCGGDCDDVCLEGDACFRDSDCDTDLTC
ncbi:hypothetical protein GOV10_06800, partial [Candidatus Woesearchaeota archaeon]|nr:hypothetical protein [Candidatus Woesearchaeota archaeon]